jgi:hypothetical protein
MMGARSQGLILSVTSTVARGECSVGSPESNGFDAKHRKVDLSELASELDHLAVDIDEARRDLARCGHRSGPHFCDQGSPRFRAAMETHLQRLDLLEDLSHVHHTRVANQANLRQPGDDHSRLNALAQHINQLRRRLVRARAAHDAQRHFCDPSG